MSKWRMSPLPRRPTPKRMFFAFATLALAGMEANMGLEPFGAVEAPDVTKNGHQGKGADSFGHHGDGPGHAQR